MLSVFVYYARRTIASEASRQLEKSLPLNCRAALTLLLFSLQKKKGGGGEHFILTCCVKGFPCLLKLQIATVKGNVDTGMVPSDNSGFSTIWSWMAVNS